MPQGKPNGTIEERFLRRTECVPCTNTELGNCRIWTGAKFSNGYGQLVKETYGTRYAHQWACHHWNKTPLPIASGMCIRHKCDTRLCVNPEHLELGSIQSNIFDMMIRNPDAFNKTEPTETELALLQTMISENTPRKQMARRIGHARTWIDRISRCE